MTDVVRFLVIVIFSIVTLSAYLVVWRVLFPQRIPNIIVQAQTAPIRTSVVGFINVLFFGIVLIGLLTLADRTNNSPFAPLFLLVSLGVAIAITVGLSMGLSSIAHIIGMRLLPQATPLRQSLIGAVGMLLACSTPFVGWFLLLPLVAAWGTGAVILHLLSSTAQARPQAPTA